MIIPNLITTDHVIMFYLQEHDDGHPTVEYERQPIVAWLITNIEDAGITQSYADPITVGWAELRDPYWCVERPAAVRSSRDSTALRYFQPGGQAWETLDEARSTIGAALHLGPVGAALLARERAAK